MSHYTVMVIGENPEEQLKPYQENNMGTCPKEYMAFNDIEDEYLKKYKTESVDKVVMPDGRLLNTWDDEFKVGPLLDRKTVILANLKVKKFKYSKLFKTFEEYMKEWCGFEKRDVQTHRYGYWQNPNAKWDWYSLGGRWAGFFKLKQHALVAAARALDTEVADEARTDQAVKEDIDLQGMREDAADKAADRYDRLARLMGGSVPVITLTWEDCLTKKIRGDKNNDKKRDLYYNQPAMKALNEVSRNMSLSKEHKEFLALLDLSKYQGGRVAYIANAMRDAISCFAIIKDGKWYERGKMGWWACVSGEKEAGDWSKEFEKLLNEVPEDTMLSVYDCHI